jgi:hypothetical protein
MKLLSSLKVGSVGRMPRFFFPYFSISRGQSEDKPWVTGWSGDKHLNRDVDVSFFDDLRQQEVVLSGIESFGGV